MAQVQYQEQEELSLDDFDKSEAFSPSGKTLRKELTLDEAFRAAKEAWPEGEPLNVGNFQIKEFPLPEVQVASLGKTEVETVYEEEDYEYLEFIESSDSDYPWRGLTEVMLGLGTMLPEWLLKTDLEEQAEKIIDRVELFIEDLPKHEKELKLIMGFCMIFYGGSWPRLASYMAAYEVFGTAAVLDEVVLVGRCFYNSFFNNEEGEYEKRVFKTDKVKEAYARVRQTIKDAGLQIAVFLAVKHVAPWAEVCLSIAFASKLKGIVRLEEVFGKVLSTSTNGDLIDESDAAWIRLLSCLCCNILSLVILGVGYPSLVVAMYMCHFGLEVILCDALKKTYSIAGVPFRFEREDWEDKTTQNYVWSAVVITSLWQAINDYSGLLESVSWLMLMFPVVKLYNLVNYGALSRDLKEE